MFHNSVEYSKIASGTNHLPEYSGNCSINSGVTWSFYTFQDMEERSVKLLCLGVNSILGVVRFSLLRLAHRGTIQWSEKHWLLLREWLNHRILAVATSKVLFHSIDRDIFAQIIWVKSTKVTQLVSDWSGIFLASTSRYLLRIHCNILSITPW